MVDSVTVVILVSISGKVDFVHFDGLMKGNCLDSSCSFITAGCYFFSSSGIT